MWNCHSSSASARMSSGPASWLAPGSPHTTQRASSYDVIDVGCRIWDVAGHTSYIPYPNIQLWQAEVLHLSIIESRHREHVALGVHADVRRRAHVFHQRRHGAASHDVHRGIRPARHEDVPGAQDFDPVVLAGTRCKRRGILARRPRLHVRTAEGSENEAAPGRVPRNAVRIVERVALG